MKELKEILCFSISLMESLSKSLEDGKIDFRDITDLWEPISKAGDAIEGISRVPDEIRALDEAKKQQLMEYVRAEFDIADDDLEAKVEGGINIALSLATYIMSFLKKKGK